MSRIPAQWLKSILLTIYAKPAITRDEIIRSTGLNPASVSQALQHLSSSGTILKVGELKSSGGRRRGVLKLNPEAGYFVAVDLETSRIRYALTNLVGDIRYRWEQELEFGKGVDVTDLLHGMEMVQRNLMEWQYSRLLGVGISCPGIIHENGCVTAVNLGWKEFPLTEKLREATSLPVALETACRSYVLAERWLGCAQGFDNCIYIEIGKGVGAARQLQERITDAIETHVLAALQRFNIFRCNSVDPCRDLRAVLCNVMIDASREGIQNPIGGALDFVLVFDNAFFRAEKPREIIPIPPVLVRTEVQVSASQCAEAPNLSPAALRVAIFQHHTLQVILGLRVTVAEERRLFGFAHDVRHADVIAIDAYFCGQWIGCGAGAKCQSAQ